MSLEDKLYGLLKVYDKSPKAIKKAFGVAYRSVPDKWLYGNAYFHFKKLLKNVSNWTPDEIRNYQEREFLKTIEVVKSTAFYPKYYKEHGVDINDITSLDQITELPFLTKRDLQEHIDQLTIDPSKGLYVTTGGSTGTPVGLYLEKGVTRGKEQAFIEHLWSRVGYKKGDSCAVLRGGVVQNSSATEKIWQIDYFRNWLQLSSFHLTDEKLPIYIEQLNRFKPKFIQGYPSALTILAKYLLKENKSLEFEPKAILAGSENLYEEQRDLLESVLNSRVYAWYGHSEKVILAGYQENDYKYHCHPLYGMTELIDTSNSVIDEGFGELVGTSFHNAICPLIRYKTADLATLLGNNFTSQRVLERIEGRSQEFIITKNERKISMAALIMHTAVFSHIEQFQFIQRTKGIVKYIYKPFLPLSEKVRNTIKSELLAKLGDDIDLQMSEVENIPLSSSGKHRILIQEVDIN